MSASQNTKPSKPSKPSKPAQPTQPTQPSQAATQPAKDKGGPALSMVEVSLDMIRVVEGFNVRQGLTIDGEGVKEAYRKGTKDNPVTGIGSPGTSIDSLADDMKRHGLAQPILVRPRKDGPGYDLVSGHRRYAAARKLAWTKIHAVVRDLTDKEAYLINMTENVQREDLTPGEIVDRAISMRDMFPQDYAPGQDGASAALARDLGVHKTYMLNLIRLREKLIPEAWALAKRGRNENTPPQHLLLKWAAMEDHDDQRRAFHEWQGIKAARDGEDGKPGESGEGDGNGEGASSESKIEYRRPGKDSLEVMEMEILGRQRNKLIPEMEAKVALAVLRYCIGKVGKDGNPPPAPYKAATSPITDAKKEAKREAKGAKGAKG